MPAPPITHENVPCTVCGCVCDDLSLTFEGDRLVHSERACELAQPWLEALNGPHWPACTVAGEKTSVEQGLEQAAELLRGSRTPLVFGLSRSSTPGQRAAIRLAEVLRGNIDTTASVCHGPSIMAIQQVGESTSTLGEVRNRADLVLFWGADPAVSHPRHFERYSVDPRGLFTPRGRADRKVIVVDRRESATSQLADEFIRIPPYRDMEVITALRMLLAGEPLDSTAELGIDRSTLESLAEQLKSCRYGALFFGLGLARLPTGHANVTALLSLVADLNKHTRFVTRRLRIPGDVAGADSVLCWQTGFPFAVNFARGYPRYNPGEYTAEALLTRGEADACVLVGSEAATLLSAAARQRLEEIPTIAFDYPHLERSHTADVHFTTAVYGIHAAGTAYRMDEVPLPLKALVESELATDAQLLEQLLARL